MTVSTLFLHDPMITLELCAVLVAFCYLAKLALSPLATGPLARGPLARGADEIPLLYLHPRRHSTVSPFRGFFSVGKLISLPKKSLRIQRNFSLRRFR